jgi:Voltage gated chloride channel
MGLQYFEALSPATIASIVAVLANRLITGNDVTGYYKYPWLGASLPSSIFTYAIVYGFYGCIIGMVYVYVVKRFKAIVHLAFHASDDKKPSLTRETKHAEVPLGSDETTPLVSNESTRREISRDDADDGVKSSCFQIASRPGRALCAGAMAGAACGLIGIFLPHTMFWGEAQLQNLIDKGRTPLPVFGSSPGLTTFACCLIDPNDADAVQAGFGIGCSAIIALAKTVVVGLSLGTGIIGGQFWGPLFVGCAASHLFTDAITLFHTYFAFGSGLVTYPCVVVLCTMAAAHVGAFRLWIPAAQISAFSHLCNSLHRTVTFRAHIAIMLVSTDRSYWPIVAPCS